MNEGMNPSVLKKGTKKKEEKVTMVSPEDIVDLAVYHLGAHTRLPSVESYWCSCLLMCRIAVGKVLLILMVVVVVVVVVVLRSFLGPRIVVHTVLIGIHCRSSDLFRRLPKRVSPDVLISTSRPPSPALDFFFCPLSFGNDFSRNYLLRVSFVRNIDN